MIVGINLYYLHNIIWDSFIGHSKFEDTNKTLWLIDATKILLCIKVGFD